MNKGMLDVCQQLWSLTKTRYKLALSSLLFESRGKNVEKPVLNDHA